MTIQKAGALGVSAFLLLALLTGPALASEGDAREPQPGTDFSIYLARVVQQEFVGLPPCPPEEICLGAFYDLTLDPVETISGNPEIGRHTFRSLPQSSPYRPGVVLIVLASRDESGEWRLLDRGPVRVEACLGPEALDAAEAFVDERDDTDWEVDDTSEDAVCFDRLHRSGS